MTDHHDLPRVKDWQLVVPDGASRFGEQATVHDVLLTLDRPLTAVQVQAFRAHSRRSHGEGASVQIGSHALRLHSVGLAHLSTQVRWALDALAGGAMTDLINQMTDKERSAKAKFNQQKQRIADALREHRSQE